MKLKVGDKAPSFSAKDDSGKTVKLSDFKGQTVVLYFYPKDMTPGCTQEACDFNDGLAAFKKKGAVILGVSKDDTERHQKFKEKYGLKFTLLTDADGSLCDDYGVWQQKSLYGRKFMGIVRSTFVIGKTGRIERIIEKVKVKDHAKDILSQL